MPNATKEQLAKINKFSQTDLKADQVFVFRSLSADTVPISRRSWFGEYFITMTDSMLEKLKKDYQVGVGLLASHNSNRLPFGRTFNAEVQVDGVGGEQVNTLYIDHYVVTHVEGDNGEKIPLRTEISGMTTQDIVNNIEVGHTFDTSIGFSMTDVKCSICKNDLRDYEQCRHTPGMKYEVQVGDKVEKMRCDIIAESGSGLENSLVYAGAVNRAIIVNNKADNDTVGLSQNQDFDGGVNFGDATLYNVTDIKNLPKEAELLCFMSKGNLQVFTNTNERRDFNQYLQAKEREPMSNVANTVEGAQLLTATPTVSQELYDQLKLEHDSFKEKFEKADGQVTELGAQVLELNEKLKTADEQIVSLTEKSKLADELSAELMEDTVKAGIAARGNAFNVERYRKYAATLSIADLREELSAFKEEFPGTVEAARVTAQETETEREGDVPVGGELSLQDIRDEAATSAMQEFRKSGGDLVSLTEKHYEELRKKYAK